MASYINLALSDAVTQALTYTLIHSLWQSAIVALCMFIAIKKYETKKASIKYNLAFAALILICCSTLFTFIFYMLRGSVDPISTATAINYSINSSDISTALPVTTPEVQNFSIWTWIDVNNYRIALTWMVGAILFATRLLIGRWHLNKVISNLNFQIDDRFQHTVDRLSKKIGLQKIVRIALSSKVEIPLLVGHLKPVIILPIAAINQLTMEETESIIAHELGHVMRNDYLHNLIIVTVESLLFFNPAVWWICNLLKTERENACDDFVLQIFPDRLNYARTLCKLQELSLKPNTSLSIHLFKNKNSLLKRIQRILNQPVYHSYVREKGWATLLIFMGVFTLTTATEVISEENKVKSPELTEDPISADNCYEAQLNTKNVSGQIANDNKGVIIKTSKYLSAPSTKEIFKAKDPNFDMLEEITIPSRENVFIVRLKNNRHSLQVPTWDSNMAFIHRAQSPNLYILKDTIDEDDLIIFTEKQKSSLAEIEDQMNGFEIEFTQQQKEQIKKMEKEMAQWSEQWSQEFQNNEKWHKLEKELSEKLSKRFGPEWQEKMKDLSKQISEQFENSEDWKLKQNELEIKLNELNNPEWQEKMARLANEINLRIVDSLDLAWTTTLSKNISDAMSNIHIDLPDHNFFYSFPDELKDNERPNDRMVQELVKQLNADGLWTTGTNKMQITNDYIKVNNKSLDAAAKEKYSKLIKNYLKTAFETKTTIKFEMEGNELKEQTNKMLSISMDKK